MNEEMLLTLTADIVSAHVTNNTVSSDQLPTLIQSVYGSLAARGKVPESSSHQAKGEPAVPIRSSVKAHAITCLDCGAKMTMLKRHLSTEHGLSVEQYRARWSLPGDYPMVAKDYSNRRKELAVKIGLGRKAGQKMKAASTEQIASRGSKSGSGKKGSGTKGVVAELPAV